MEKVTGTENTIEVFENDIELFLSMFCDEQGIENLKQESQSVWNGCLRYIRKNVFKDKSILKSSNNITIPNNSISSNFNAYNYELVSNICDIYIDLCFMYDKEISIMGFSNLTNIDQDNIYNWANSINNNNSLSTSGYEIYKKLNILREESLSNKLVTGKQNPVGVLGVLNRHYQWNMPGVSREKANNNTLTAADLPQLAIDNSQTISTIQDNLKLIE